MNLPLTPELREVARRIFWFEAPDQALSDTARFMAYAFRYATYADMTTLRRHLSDHDLREALDTAPPGIIDGRSWSYWRLMLDLPERPLPQRVIPDHTEAA